MRRILFTVTSGDLTGGQKVCAALMEAVSARGDCALLVSPSAGRFTQKAAAAGIAVYVVPLERRTFGAHVRALVRLLRQQRVDLAATHCTVPGNLAARLAAAVAGVPLVSHIHIPNPLPRTRLRRRCVALLDAASARLVRLVIAVSADTASALLAQGYPARKVVVVPNGVDCPPPRNWQATAARRDGRLPTVVSVARLCETKGQRELIDAVALLRRRGRRVRLELVGEDLVCGGAYRAALEARATALGVREDVEFCGHRDDVQELVAAADIFVLASSAEGLSLALLEAMGAGKPVVATRVGGTPEVVRDGATGVLVPPRDVGAMARAIEGLVAEPARAARLGAAARELVARHFSRRTMVERTLALYDQVMEEAA